MTVRSLGYSFVDEDGDEFIVKEISMGLLEIRAVNDDQMYGDTLHIGIGALNSLMYALERIKEDIQDQRFQVKMEEYENA
jgi:hypothetical protein